MTHPVLFSVHKGVTVRNGAKDLWYTYRVFLDLLPHLLLISPSLSRVGPGILCYVHVHGSPSLSCDFVRYALLTFSGCLRPEGSICVSRRLSRTRELSWSVHLGGINRCVRVIRTAHLYTYSNNDAHSQEDRTRMAGRASTPLASALWVCFPPTDSVKIVEPRIEYPQGRDRTEWT